jgi:hypothetical protein
MALPYLEMMDADASDLGRATAALLYVPAEWLSQNVGCKGVGTDFQLSSILSPLWMLKRHISVCPGSIIGVSRVQRELISTGKAIQAKRCLFGSASGGSGWWPYAAFAFVVLGSSLLVRYCRWRRAEIAYANTVSWNMKRRSFSKSIPCRLDATFRDRTGPCNAQRRRLAVAFDLVLGNLHLPRKTRRLANQASSMNIFNRFRGSK